MLVTDHPHLFETGGENYHTDFFGWEYLRGHEGDPWRTCPDPTWVGTPARPAVKGGWWCERVFGRERAEHDRSRLRPVPHLVPDRGATTPVRRPWRPPPSGCAGRAPHHDRWLLFVDEFDPHEPFDTPEPWTGRYDDEPWQGDDLIWPPYADGAIVERQAQRARGPPHPGQLRREAVDDRPLVRPGPRRARRAGPLGVHRGHRVHRPRPLPRRGAGGRDIWGKPAVPQYEPLGHTPLLVHWPGRPGGGTVDALTTNVDLHATLSDVFGVSRRASHPRRVARAAPHRRRRPGARVGDRRGLRQLGADHRRDAQVRPGTRGRRLPARPCGRTGGRRCRSTVSRSRCSPKPDDRAALAHMPGSTVPVLRQPFQAGDLLPFFADSAADRRRPPPLRPRRRPRRAGEPARRDRPRRTGPTFCARRCARSRRPPSSSHAPRPWTDPSSATG